MTSYRYPKCDAFGFHADRGTSGVYLDICLWFGSFKMNDAVDIKFQQSGNKDYNLNLIGAKIG